MFVTADAAAIDDGDVGPWGGSQRVSDGIVDGKGAPNM